MSHQREVAKGRFAPSPTGPLHFGSLIAAAASYLEAHRSGGEWLVRIEDIDPPREPPGSADAILRTLEAFGFEWNGPVLFQSSRADAYVAALDQLRESGLLYPCDCSRKAVNEAAASAGLAPGVYSGHCARRPSPPTGRVAWRVRTDPSPITFEDRVRGDFTQRLANEVGDFVLRRADGLFAYQLAVVVDDAGQGITDVVRGSDLLDNTPRQIHLQRCLGLPTPRYMHLPIAVDAHGDKLSKQTHAPPLDDTRPVPSLWAALDFLNQAPPPALRTAALPTLWQWAHEHWSAAPLQGIRSRPAVM